MTSTQLEDRLLALLAVDTAVPAGATTVEPGDARMIAAVEDVVLPMVEALGPDEVRRHPSGEVAARFGPAGPDGLLLQTYLVSQHGNLMDDPTGARVTDGAPLGLEGPCAVGQGANQNKGPMAAALQGVADRPGTLLRPVWLTVNLEGRSSHGGSERIIDDLGVEAAAGVVMIGTDLAVSRANRGRVDLVVDVAGAAAHSSQPWLGRNPLEGGADIITSLRSLPLPPPHPQLGGGSATPFLLEAGPVAPHTIPAAARLLVDRRLLPGEDPEEAAAALRDHLSSLEHDLTVTAGAVMLPAEVPPSAPIVGVLGDGLRGAGRAPELMVSANTFDAGLACSRGIPTVMFGPGRRRFDAGVTAAEAVAIGDCRTAAAVLRHTIRRLCS